MRLIDADAIKYHEVPSIIMYEKYHFRYVENYEIDMMDSIDAQPVKHGHWEVTDAFPHRVYCSECYEQYIPNEEWIFAGAVKPAEFCPHCGAKMDEKMEV